MLQYSLIISIAYIIKHPLLWFRLDTVLGHVSSLPADCPHVCPDGLKAAPQVIVEPQQLGVLALKCLLQECVTCNKCMLT